MQIQNPMNASLPDSAFGGGLVLPYQEKTPVVGEDVFIAPNACVIGDVILGDRASVWFGAVLRGDIAPVRVGEGSNIQDASVLHVGDDAPCVIHNNVVAGHRVTLHGCEVEDNCLIGMGSIILDHAVIGEGSIIAAGSVVTRGTIIPPNSLALGTPAKVIREVTDEERRYTSILVEKYMALR